MTENEKTAPISSVGADEGQSSNNNIIISQSEGNCNSQNDLYRMMVRKMLDPSYLPTMSMSDLYENTYEKKPPIIDGLLYSGTYLFVGAPKVGKSFFMLQLAYHISTGTPLWNYPVKKGTVLYLALEDDYRRLQERLYRMFDTENTPDLHFSISANPLGKGLNEQLQGFIREHPDTSLIIVDTLQKVREASGDNFSYSADYDTITKLKQFTDSYNISLLVVHHTRKQKSDDTFETISGTNGLLGAADGAFILHKEKRTSNKAILEISGRDQQDQKITLVRNEEKLSWDFESAETELWKAPPEPILEKIAEFVTAENPEWTGTATELIEKIGTDTPVNAITKKLNINASRLLNEYQICYQSSRTHDGRKLEFHFQANPP